MSLDPPSYLLSLQNNIRQRPIPWEGAVRAGHITDTDLKRIKAVDKVRKEQRRQAVEGDLESYATLILGGNGGKSVLESAGKRGDVVQYILVLAGDLIDGRFYLIRSSFWMTPVHLLPQWLDLGLIELYRLSTVDHNPPITPVTLRAILTSPKPIIQPRGSYPASHVYCAHQSDCKCSFEIIQVISRSRKSPAKALDIPIYTGQEFRQRSPRYRSPRILDITPYQKVSPSLLAPT